MDKGISQNIINKKNHISYNLIYACLFILAFSQDSIIRYFQVLISRLPYLNLIAPLTYYIIFSLLILLCIRDIILKIKVFDLFIILTFFLILIISYFNINNQVFIIDNMGLIMVLPLYYLLGRNILIDKKAFKIFYFFSIFAIVINILYLLYYISSDRLFSVDSMYESYGLLFNVFIVIGYSIYSKSIWGYIFSSLGILYIFAMGTRGPLLLIVCYIFILFMFFIMKSKKNRFLVISFVLLFIILELLFNITNQLLLIMVDFLKSMNLSTRIFETILYGEHSESLVEREVIYSTLINLLEKNPLIGYGFFGEYHYIGWSAHNIYLQTLFNLGVIVGPILIFLYIVNFIASIIKALDYEKMILWIFFSYVLIQGVFGGNLISGYVFASVGIIFNKYITSRLKQRG